MKISVWTFSAVALLSLLFFSCSEKPDFDKIYAGQDETKQLMPDTSEIFTQVSISIKDLEKELNSKLGNRLYFDKDYINRKGVDLKMNVDRTGDIRLNTRDDKLFYAIPLKITGSARIDQNILGVKVKAFPGFALSLTLELSTEVEFNEELELMARTKIEQIIWPQRPGLRAGPLFVDLADPLEAMIFSFEKDLSEIVQRTASSELKIKERLIDVLSKVPTYNYIKTKDLNLWMELKPLNLMLESRPELKEDSVKINAGIKGLMSIVNERNGSDFINAELLAIELMESSPQNFNIHLKMTLSYSDLDSLIEKRLLNQTMSSLPEEIRINGIKSGKYNDNEVYLAANLEGDLNGLIFNHGEIAYDSLNDVLYLKKLKTQLYTGNSLLDFISSFLLESNNLQLEEKIKWPLSPLFERVQMAVKKLVNRISNKGDLNLELRELELNLREINLRKDEIEVLIHVQGESQFRYNL